MKYQKTIPYIAAAIIVIAAIWYFLPQQNAAPIALQATSTESTATTSAPVATPEQSASNVPAVSAQSTPIPPAPTAAPAPSGPEITLTAGSSTYESAATTSETVIALMQNLASSTSFIFADHYEMGLGFFIDSIDGEANANGSYWFLYINGTSSQLGASSEIVSPGDSVEWRYEKND